MESRIWNVSVGANTLSLALGTTEQNVQTRQFEFAPIRFRARRTVLHEDVPEQQPPQRFPRSNKQEPLSHDMHLAQLCARQCVVDHRTHFMPNAGQIYEDALFATYCDEFDFRNVPATEMAPCTRAASEAWRPCFACVRLQQGRTGPPIARSRIEVVEDARETADTIWLTCTHPNAALQLMRRITHFFNSNCLGALSEWCHKTAKWPTGIIDEANVRGLSSARREELADLLVSISNGEKTHSGSNFAPQPKSPIRAAKGVKWQLTLTRETFLVQADALILFLVRLASLHSQGAVCMKHLLGDGTTPDDDTKYWINRLGLRAHAFLRRPLRQLAQQKRPNDIDPFMENESWRLQAIHAWLVPALALESMGIWGLGNVKGLYTINATTGLIELQMNNTILGGPAQQAVYHRLELKGAEQRQRQKNAKRGATSTPAKEYLARAGNAQRRIEWNKMATPPPEPIEDGGEAVATVSQQP